MCAGFGQQTCSQREITCGTLHLLANCYNTENRNCKTFAHIYIIRQIAQRVKLARRAYKALNCHAGSIHANSIFNFNADIAKAHIVLEHTGVSSAAQSNSLVMVSGNAGTQCASCCHQAIRILHQRRNCQIKTFQACGRTHDITMIKSQHNSAAVISKNLSQTRLHAPACGCVPLYRERTLRRSNADAIIFCQYITFFICHIQSPA